MIRVLIYMMVLYEPYIIFAFVVQSIIFAVYLYHMEYSKWWVCLLPFGVYYARYELGTAPLWLGIVAGITAFLTHMGIIPISIIWLGASMYSNYKFCLFFVEVCNPIVFSCVPLAKYIIMLKEVIVCKN